MEIIELQTLEWEIDGFDHKDEIELFLCKSEARFLEFMKCERGLHFQGNRSCVVDAQTWKGSYTYRILKKEIII